VAAVERVLGPRRPRRHHGLVTAGGTREAIDPVRFIGNRSSGKQGHALAAEPRCAGRPGHPGDHRTRSLSDSGVETVMVESAAEMHDAVLARRRAADVVVMAAAVADFTPRRRSLAPS
jgi:phosphopantothenoylcysteine decarboxylase / phosphopantothenate---cysteine ligase